MGRSYRLHCFQVEELDRGERSPDLPDPSAEVAPVEEIDERAFEPGDGEVEPGPVTCLDTGPFPVGTYELPRKRDRAESLTAEPEGPRSRPGEDADAFAGSSR